MENNFEQISERLNSLEWYQSYVGSFGLSASTHIEYAQLDCEREYLCGIHRLRSDGVILEAIREIDAEKARLLTDPNSYTVDSVVVPFVQRKKSAEAYENQMHAVFKKLHRIYDEQHGDSGFDLA